MQKQLQEEKNKNDIAIQEITTQKKNGQKGIDTSSLKQHKVSHKI